ncbi:MAG: hypothetical protein KGL37_01325 [Acidobacteriota bacterium]|nr:hypothetical protein [Acidobacteriota bacterium]
MVLRISLWALTGFVAACGWILYGMVAGPSTNVGSWTVVAITAPPLLVWRAIPLAYSSVVFINAAIYALIGYLTEPLWQRLHIRTRSR